MQEHVTFSHPLDCSYLENKFRPHNRIKFDRSTAHEERTNLDRSCARPRGSRLLDLLARGSPAWTCVHRSATQLTTTDRAADVAVQLAKFLLFSLYSSFLDLFSNMSFSISTLT